MYFGAKIGKLGQGLFSEDLPKFLRVRKNVVLLQNNNFYYSI